MRGPGKDKSCSSDTYLYPRHGAEQAVGFWSWRKSILLLQLFATAVILGWIPGNGLKLAAMVLVWAATFGRFTAQELLLMAIVNLLFVGMDLGALRRGIFKFYHPDLLGLPIYEFLMWGFYALHTMRFLDGPVPRRPPIWVTLGLTIAFSLPFSLIPDPLLLFAATGVILAVSLALLHDPMDFAYLGYMVAVGVLIEYVGVSTGQWSYPGSPYGGVPLWSFTMWGGIGLFTRRLLIPLREQFPR